MKRPVIGILALQGSVQEHRKALESVGSVEVLEVKTPSALALADSLILPGGESTTIAKLLSGFGLSDPLRERILKGMPVWGTCAGMILLAKEIVGEPAHLNVMDVTVRRNAYGRQIDSFSCVQSIPAFSREPIPLVFIRAPWIERVGEGVEVLCRVGGKIVAARQENMLATSFHPELTDNLCVHRYFAEMTQRAAMGTSLAQS